MEPKYDEDIVNLGYLKKIINSSENSIKKQVNKTYGSRPNPPYYKGDTYIINNVVYTCINTREIGLYNENDWVTESGAKKEAQNKNKVFLTKPSKYTVGDMWILQTDSDHKSGKKGEILITTASRSQYDEDDWINMLGYGSISSINEVSEELNSAISRIGNVEEAIQDGIIITFYQDIEPVAKHIGDLWYLTGEVEGYIKGKLYRYDGSKWQLLDDPSITEAFEKANEARLVADGKIQSFYSDTEPSNDIGVGDLWINTSENNKLYRYNGTKWIEVYDTRLDEIKEEMGTVTQRVATIETDFGKINLTVNEQISKSEKNQEEVKKNISDLTLDIDSLEYSNKKIGGNNLIKNSDMSNGTNFWLKHLSRAFAESPTAPENPSAGDYWYCTSSYESYNQNQMYYYNGTIWISSALNRKQLEQTQNLLSAVSSYEDEYTRKKTVSGRMLKFNASDPSVSSHLFTATNFIDFKDTEEYASLSFKIKNSIKTGFIFISLAFYHKTLEELETNYSDEILQAMYTKDIVVTPDDLKDLTEIQLTTKVPKKENFIPVYVGTTAPTDTTKKWMDNTINAMCVLKEYNSETEQWEVSKIEESCYDETLRNIYFRSSFVGGNYVASAIDYDSNQIKSVVVAICHYGGYLINVAETRPDVLPKNYYWLDQAEGGYAWRTKYNGDEFVGWKKTDVTTAYVLTNTVPSPPFPTIYQVRPTGYFEIADLKAEWNNVCTQWSRFDGEVYGKNYKMDEKGFRISSNKNEMFIDEDEIIATYGDEKIFKISEDETYLKKIKTKEINIGDYVLKTQNIKNTEHLIIY